MQIIKGRHFIVYFEKDGAPSPVCYSTDFTIQMSRDFVETTGATAQDRTYLPTYKGYTLGISAVVSYIDGYTFIDIENAYKNGTVINWRGTDSEIGGVVHSGQCYIQNLSWASPVRADLTNEVACLGTGPKVTQLLPYPSTPYLADENKVRLPGCPNPYPVGVYWYNEDGSGFGTFIGIAFDNDDVVELLNGFEENGGVYAFSVGTSGCDFNALSAWNAPFVPDVIFAQATPDLGLSPDQDNNMGLSPDQDEDQVLSPAYA